MKTKNQQLNTVKKFFSFFLTGLAFQAFGQQLYYSQYQLTPMLNNPSLIALTEEIKIDAGYRNQFGGKGGNYSTPLFSGYMPIYKESVQNVFTKLGAGGIQLFTDRTGYGGMLATTGFSITYAHLIHLSGKDKLSFGLTPGFFQRRVDFSGLKSGSQWDSFSGDYKEQLPLNEEIAQTERRTFLTINSGLTYLRERANGDQFFTFSLGASNLTRPNISLNSKSFSNPVGWNIQSTIVAYENDQFIIKPTFRHIQVRNLNQTNLGSYFYYKTRETKGLLKKGTIGIGAWYSNQNAVVFALEINQRDWALGFSYDILTSDLSNAQASTGAPEIIVGFRKYIGKRKAPLPEMGGPTNKGGSKSGSDMKEPSKAQPTPSEITPAPEIKPEAPKEGDATAPPVERKEVETMPEAPVVPNDATKAGENKTSANKKVPAVAPKTVSPAKKPGVSPAKKPGAKKSSKKPASKTNLKSNVKDPALIKKVSQMRTSDADLGEDPYKGTDKELKPEELDLFKQQPHFDLGSANNKDGFEVDDVAKMQLSQMAEAMKSRPDLKLEIGGYGCDKGGPEVTKLVSQGRAESVRRYLISLGVPAGQLSARGYGVANPAEDNTTEEGRVMNRRVQFKFVL